MPINMPTSPSCSHPFGAPLAVSEAPNLSARLAITAYAMRHAPESNTAVRELWLRTFDRHDGKIPPADWRTAIRKGRA